MGWFFALFMGLAHAQTDFKDVLPMSVEDLVKASAEQIPCSSLSVSSLCRAFPWPPRKGEGVVKVGATAVVFVREAPPEGSRMSSWLRKFPEDKRQEFYTLLAAVSERTANAFATASMSSLLILVLRDTAEGGGRQVKSALFTSQGVMSDFLPRWFPVFQSELDATTGTWYAPTEFVPFYQYAAY